MRIGINEVLIYSRASGARQRELNILPTLLRILEENKHEAVVYISSSLRGDLLEKLTGGISCELIKTPLPAIPTYKRISIGSIYWKRRIHRDKIDIFHTPYFPVPDLPIPSVLTIHDLRFKIIPNSYTRPRRIFLNLVVPLSVRRAARIIAVSEDTKKDIVKFYNKSSKVIDVVHNIPGKEYIKVEDNNKLIRVRQKYSLPQRYILYVGHLEPRKNLSRLFDAFKTLTKKKRFFHHLVILGKPSFGYRTLLESIDSQSIRSRVTFTDYIDEEDLISIYTLADLFVLPSLHEGFGVPILEAMSCGVPVVTSNTSAMPEAAGGAAILVDPYDVNSIATGIMNVLDDKKLTSNLIIRGRDRVSYLTAERAALKILNTYNKTYKESNR